MNTTYSDLVKITQNNYKFTTAYRDYKDITIFNAQTLKEIPKSSYIYRLIQPFTMKLFNQDIFTIRLIQNNETDGLKCCFDNTILITQLKYSIHYSIEILHSSTREIQYLSGVLDISKKYGCIGKKSLYKVIPDDKRLSEFLIPYKVRKIGFHKHSIQKYVTIQFVSWNEKQKHPIGKLIKVIGNVDDLGCFYEYQLYCKSLYSSIQDFTKKAMDKIKETTEHTIIDTIMKKYGSIENRLHRNIISIDPIHCKDIDDAFSLYYDVEKKNHILSVYISNVSIWMDFLDLWDSFANRVSTIYLPDRKRPMLPTMLSDNLCSLLEGRKRIAFTLDFIIQNNEIIETKISNSLIQVKKNYWYNENDLMKEQMYNDAFNVVSNLKFKYNYITYILDSHDFISYLMVLMNKTIADYLMSYKNGIYRSLKINQEFTTSHLNIPSIMKKFLHSWNSSGGFYVLYSDSIQQNKHEMMNIDSYIHITSPIRRLADLLNMIQIQKNMRLFEFSNTGNIFLNHWTHIDNINYINVTMRSIRKVQNSCFILDVCVKDKELLKQKHSGYIFDKIIRNDGLYQYMVYLEDSKLQTCGRFTSRFNLENFHKYYFRLYLFKNHIDAKKKIMINIEKDDNGFI